MNDERIPTMPQGIAEMEERIPTMPQGVSATEERIPTMPQGVSTTEERIPTMPQGISTTEGRIATIPQGMPVSGGRVATVPQQESVRQGIVGGRLLVTSDINFTGDRGNTFVIEASNVISADSGESQIYGCHKIVGDEKYVARVLISITPESDIEKRQTRDKVIRFLDGMSANDESHILPLLEHGTININEKTYFVEIYPFCDEGDLGKRKGQFSYQELKDEVIPAINQALHYFHSSGLVHRDVKPDNLYKYKGKVVIGDFGITCDLREDGFATDRFKTGTLGYYAPELMSQAAIKASDYYSFGQTIWTLYSGEMMYRNVLRRYKEYGLDEQRNQVNFAMLSNTYFGLDEISKSDEFLEILIRGLLQYDPSHRFDYEKVKRWIEGDKSIAHEISDFDAAKTFTRSFKLFGKECWDDGDVCETMSLHWDESVEVLYDGVLKDFYASQSYEHARFLDGIMKNYSVCDNEEAIPFINNIGLAKVILYFSKNKILCWKGSVYQKLNDISVALEKSFEKEEMDNDYYGLVYSELIGEWYASMPNQQNDVLETLNELTDLLKTNEYGENIALYWLMYLFAEEDKLQKERCNDLQSYVRLLLAEKNKIYGAGDNLPIVDDYSVLGLLCAWGYSETVKLFHLNMEKDYATRYEMFFDFIEQQMDNDEDKKIVSNYYFEYGPKAYLNWWKNNLQLYEFNGSVCKSLEQSIRLISVDKDASISEQRVELEKLQAVAQKFVNCMDADLFIGRIGIQGTNENYIFTSKLSGVWQYEFLGQSAPIGFKYFIEL